MSSMALNFEQRQHQTLSPRLQRAVRLLQLSSAEFAEELHDTLGNNPFLEADESGSDAESGAEIDTESDVVTIDTAYEDVTTAALATAEGHDLQAVTDYVIEDFDSERESWQSDFISPASPTHHGEFDLMDMQPVHLSLTAHLHSQLNVLPLAERDLVLAHAIIESLDDDGYLRCDLDEIAGFADLNPQATPEELLIALKRVQAMEPHGVAARGVAECLLLQLPTIECEETRDLAGLIISDHLERLAAKDIDGLARQLRRSATKIEAVCDRIRQLDPRPGARFTAAPADYIVPDIVVKKVRGTWTAALNPAVVPRVRLNQVYAEMAQRHRATLNAELASHLQEARWTVNNVEQRFATILSVAQAIVSRQRHFFDFGAMAMKPLGLREIAVELGMHESTVSRVTNNKYMATPLGVFELKYFFSRTMQTASGGACSPTAIRSLVKDMIAGEQADAPLSDAEIARQLAKQGLVVARRTVTKYRQLLRIEAVERRRRH